MFCVGAPLLHSSASPSVTLRPQVGFRQMISLSGLPGVIQDQDRVQNASISALERVLRSTSTRILSLSLSSTMPMTMTTPSLRSIAKFALGSAQVALLPSFQTVHAGTPPSCPNPQLSCQNTTVVQDTCCFNAPGGQLLQTQFWDTNPPTGPVDSWTLHGLWYVLGSQSRTAHCR